MFGKGKSRDTTEYKSASFGGGVSPIRSKGGGSFDRGSSGSGRPAGKVRGGLKKMSTFKDKLKMKGI